MSQLNIKAEIGTIESLSQSNSTKKFTLEYLKNAILKNETVWGERQIRAPREGY